MIRPVIRFLYETTTGRPWTSTTRHATAEFGPNLAARYAAEWAHLSDHTLSTADRADLVAYAEAIRARRTRQRPALHR
ncbi:hypothetical protein CS0771_40460 [Catellatospora sp. IY07-71]|uniref:hypothetical protein n=1 Tax=Catellatospora sp. IY07-71 TaxID=2728827 RepID=UPI001BB32AA6|nr:hypothetical protein [Catellatospora sp. IY07-71]BCJ74502.1 hypothetical protein CS0771_40460 [Catellatospora sp. IY07-71]